MIVLTTTSDIVRLVTTEALALDVHASFVDNSATSYRPERQNTTITTATTTTVVSAPASGIQRGVKKLQAQARGGANIVTVEYFDGTNAYRLQSVSLALGETLEYEDGQGWRVLTALGELKGLGATGPTGATGSFAVKSDQEAATSTVLHINPAVQQFHPSAVKAHGSTTGGGTPVLSANAYNISSITDTGTGILTVNFTTAFSAADYTVVYSVTNSGAARQMNVESKAVGSMVLHSRSPTTPGTLLDPDGYNFACFGDQ